ncbi:MAG: folate family ECF transporter S component [Bacillota bacterium]|nr:folate family ECF transporter S component [Bacillota bacterium]
MKIKVVSTLVKAALLMALSVIFARFLSVMIPIAGFPALRLGFTNIPLILSGVFFGPFVGFLTGVLADLIGVVIWPQGPYHPGLTLTSGLEGFWAGMLFFQLRIYKAKWNFKYLNAVVIIALGILFMSTMKQPETLDFGSIVLIAAMVVVIAVYAALPAVLDWLFTRKQSLRKGIGFDKVAFMISINYIVNSVILNTFFLSQLFNKGYLVLLPGRLLAGLFLVPINSVVIFTVLRFLAKLDEEGNMKIQKN